MNVPTEKQPVVAQLAQMAIKPFRTPLLKNPKDYGMDYQEMSFKTPDGIELKAWYIPAENSDKLIVVNHPMPMNRYGYPGHLEAFSQLFPDEVNFIKTYEQLHKAGYNVLTYDLRNHGESGGANQGICGIGMFEYQDAIGAMNYIKSHPELSKMKLGFLSHCTGGNATLKAIATEPELFKDVKALVVPQPCNMAYLVDTFSQMFGVAEYKEAIDEEMVKLGGLKAAEMNPYPFAPNISIPTLISQVKDDTWTKPEDVQKTFDLIPTKDKKLVWIEGANRRFDGYNYFGEHPEEMIHWFNQFMAE
jgi:alpha-beta hydrolase superfamily lysophospholipase